MDSSSWIHGYAANGGGNSGFMCAYGCAASSSMNYSSIGSQIQEQHLNQISMHMSMDDVEPAVYGGAVPSCDIVVDDFDFLQNSLHATGGCSFPSSSSTTSSFRSASLPCSPEISLHVLAAPGISSFPGVSSQVPLVLPYDDHQYAVNFHDTPEAMAPWGSAFRRYERHLGPPRRLTKPACGQRMFKTAMSVLDKMHTAMRYSQQQQQQASAAEPLGNQLQHMISERKRQEKLNGSFRALRAVLPPGSKKDKTSTLIITREYVNSLKSKVRELEEKLQAQLARRPTSGAVAADEEEAESGEKAEIQITAAEGDQSREVCTVNIAMPARGNTTNVVLRTLQCLKDRVGEDVRLMSMSTGDGPHNLTVTLHLKSATGAKWEEKDVREAVTKAVATPAPAVLSDGVGGSCARSGALVEAVWSEQQEQE